MGVDPHRRAWLAWSPRGGCAGVEKAGMEKEDGRPARAEEEGLHTEEEKGRTSMASVWKAREEGVPTWRRRRVGRHAWRRRMLHSRRRRRRAGR